MEDYSADLEELQEHKDIVNFSNLGIRCKTRIFSELALLKKYQ